MMTGLANRMRVPFYDIKAQYDELSTELDAVTLEVMASGHYSMGKYHKLFEEEMAALHQVKHAIAVNSGTDALRISMEAAGIGAGDEVITTAFTFVASTETIVQTGARPVFVDIDGPSFQIDPTKIEAAITPRTKAIVPIHLFGQLVDVEAINKIAQKHNLIVIEDAAQAVATRFKGVPSGNFGLAATLSFYVTKNLGAAGDAGLILTNDDGVAERSRSIRVHGMGRERYYYDHLGYTSRMHEIQAAVLHVKLAKLADWNERRREIAAIYLRELEGLDGLTLPVTTEGNTHTWHQFTIRAERRDAMQTFLKGEGIDSMIYYPVPLHFHSPYEQFGAGKGSLPVTERTCEEVLSLPCHPHMSVEAAKHVAAKVSEFATSKVTA